MQDISSLKRNAWMEVNLAAIRHNVRTIKSLMAPTCKLMAIVKADAYGHGAGVCARAMASAGAQQFGVATVQEALELRQSGIAQPIVLLSEPPVETIDLLLENDIMPGVTSSEFVLAYGERAIAHDMVGKYHLALDTGMTRIGIPAEDAVEFRRLVDFHRGIACAGTYTHFATADTIGDWDFRRQVQRFTDAIRALHEAKLYPGIVHCDNTAATMLYPDIQFDMCRVGIALYGIHPAESTVELAELEPAMSIRARITRVANPRIGDGVSYGMTYRVNTPYMQIATIPIGYADGLSRSLSGEMDVLVHGRRARQVGRICMDQCMFAYPLRSMTSSTMAPELAVGDVVTIMGSDEDEYISADEIGQLRHTIAYEVLCNFSARLERIYVS